ncbi:glutamine-hydrolyzing carbamoyl-phosphate synthase small subunit [Buchnera aphidicola (Mindarus keteleerifoliae)]|uniref:glutamine-hydrolyzing carbamoyl-phosphate synthase small subunit n=1 Tax=Buchnera aphidicola TaxID=9 RepID=UPI0031B6EDDC
MRKSATLVLEDGTIFFGKSVGEIGSTVGEVVFNTSITGYQEILTDPSYSHQLIVLTHPHIGNVGINVDDGESKKIYAKGLIVKDVSLISSNYRSTSTFPEYLKKNNIICISDIDTRKLTRIIRTKGSQNGCIISGKEYKNIKKANDKIKNFKGLQGVDLVQKVSTQFYYKWKKDLHPLQVENNTIFINKKKISFHVVVYDLGVKKSMLRMLFHRNCSLTVVPAKTSFKETMKLSPDGIFLSNGPGDPRPCKYIIGTIKKFLKMKVPMFGICLGHQLLALASGAKIIKMKFGHHGANHPVKDINSNSVLITSQNHGFTVDPKTISKNIEITHKSLFDNSLQGLKWNKKPVFSFQGHPEASPGPHDSSSLFDYFIKLMETNYKQKNSGKNKNAQKN